MTNPTTPDREQEIRARVDAATPGGWFAVELPPNEHYSHPAHWVNTEYTEGDITTSQTVADCPWRQADAEFIANAREDVTWLLDKLAHFKASYGRAYNGLHETLTENARLKRAEADRDAAVAAARRSALEDAAKRQREFVLSDDFVCDDWESALTVVDLIDPAVAAPVREQGDGALLCGAREPEPRTGTSPCNLPAGHGGPKHMDHWTNQWPVSPREQGEGQTTA